MSKKQTNDGATTRGRKPRLDMARTCAAAGLSLVLGLAGTPALAEESQPSAVGGDTTKVTVVADSGNLRFRVPTVIPFVAASDGTLTGPSPQDAKIENLSAFGLKVTNVRIESANGWNHSSDVNGSDNSIDWRLGPQSSMVSAADAATESGVSVSNPAWNMTYASADTQTDEILLSTSGSVGRVTQDISSPVHIGTVRFTVAAGAHTADGASTNASAAGTGSLS